MDRKGFWEQEQQHPPAARIAAAANNNLSLAPAATAARQTGSPQIKFEAGSTGSGIEAISGSASGKHLICNDDQQSIFRYCEGNLNFATVSAGDDDELNYQKKKALSRDPMSHRIIEKRRRDRMNNCLADLSRLIPAEYLKKGRGRVEKTEIIEMAIKHMKYLQAHACNHAGQESCEHAGQETQAQGQLDATPAAEHYRLGYQECLTETMHFLVEIDGYYSHDALCEQLLNHLQKHCEKIVKGDRLNFSRPMRSETSSSSSRCYSGYSGGPSSTSSGSDSGGNGHSSSSKENVACNSEWRRQSDMEEMASPVLMQTGLVLPPPPPLATSEQADSPSQMSDAGSDAATNCSSSSQLREMLTGAASAGAVPSGHQRRHSESAARVADSVAAGLYKFKNNIKQRFTAEHHHDECKRRRLLSAGADGGIPSGAPASVVVKLRGGGGGGDSGVDSPPTNLIVKQQSPSPMDASTPPEAATPPVPFGVPVFALHSKGAFYIPLTVDNELLAPYMSGFSENGHVLHPVTISVNFCGLAAAPQQQAAPMVPWRGEPAGFMPKWSVCDRT
ncbi:transcription factor cwo isoform X1 [Cloeon dipterum]|uniref:transcription factor cwo isoform X1 n=2 Tax=Cloeon dipterum TaxID=197152 RepID=UPI0032203B96